MREAVYGSTSVSVSSWRTVSPATAPQRCPGGPATPRGQSPCVERGRCALYGGLRGEAGLSPGWGSSLHPIERANLGDLRTWCGTAIHLQCASGRDTLSLWNEGVAEVIGVDIADVHIANAQRLSAALGAPATWYRCDVLETPSTLDGRADLVYTGQGALCWLHDLDAGRRSCGGY